MPKPMQLDHFIASLLSAKKSARVSGIRAHVRAFRSSARRGGVNAFSRGHPFFGNQYVKLSGGRRISSRLSRHK